MTRRNHRPLSPNRRETALVIAAIVGVAVDGCLTHVKSMLAIDIGWFPSAGTMTTYMVMGSFIAVPLCLLVGLPFLVRAERTGRRTRRDAIRNGATAGLIIRLPITILQIAAGIEPWLPDAPPHGGLAGGFPMATKAAPIFTEWAMKAFDLVGYSIAGSCAGLVARRLAFGRDQGSPPPDARL